MIFIKKCRIIKEEKGIQIRAAPNSSLGWMLYIEYSAQKQTALNIQSKIWRNSVKFLMNLIFYLTHTHIYIYINVYSILYIDKNRC